MHAKDSCQLGQVLHSVRVHVRVRGSCTEPSRTCIVCSTDDQGTERVAVGHSCHVLNTYRNL